MNVWLALNVRVVYNSDSIWITGISIIMFQVPTLEPKKHKKSVLSLMKVYKFQFLQKRVSGILYSRCLSTLDRIRSTELTGYGSSHQRCSIKKGVLRNIAKFTGKQLCHSFHSGLIIPMYSWPCMAHIWLAMVSL